MVKLKKQGENTLTAHPRLYQHGWRIEFFQYLRKPGITAESVIPVIQRCGGH